MQSDSRLSEGQNGPVELAATPVRLTDVLSSRPTRIGTTRAYGPTGGYGAASLHQQRDHHEGYD